MKSNMWRPEKNAKPVPLNFPISIERVLYEFDGPMIFTSKFGMYQVLFSRIDEDDDCELYAAGTVNDEIIDAIANGSISVLGGLLSEPCFVMEFNGLFANQCWELGASEMPMDLFPESGQGLLPGKGLVPDTIEQLNSYFSIRFSGDGLARDTMLFSTFKGLVDRVYEATRKLIAPAELQNTKSATFDFRLLEPAFGSLVLTIDSPSVKLVNARRHFDNPNLPKSEMDQFFDQSRDDFFTELDQVITETQDNNSFRSSAEKHIDLLKNLQELIPHEDSQFNQVEFHASLSTGLKTVVVDEETGERLKRAYMSVVGHYQTTRGQITIINNKRRTFVIDAQNGREITCSMDDGAFRNIESNDFFRGGNKIEVSGNLYKRPRRDYIAVDGTPLLLNDRWEPLISDLFS
ncbi:hypothetical protein GHK80_18555 [Sinorhizobium medicae]|nr:hypothetical protein [Sinorhizobium medicae]